MKLISCHSLSAAKRDIIIALKILQARELERGRNVFESIFYKFIDRINISRFRYEIKM